jgi:pyruvate dehydrogenase E1 component beta subunit
MAQLQLREAIRRAMTEEMRRDDRVFLMGEEVADYQGAYKVSQGMLEEFGEKRIIDTPINENGFCGLGIGAAMSGLIPIIELMTWNFSLVAYDQIINSAAKMYQMTGGQYSVPIVFRGANGAAENLGSQHSMALESIFAHFPGLKVISTATPRDAYGLLKSAIRDPDPIIFMESEISYSVKGEVEDEEFLIPIGKADIKRAGTDVTLVTWGKMVFTTLEAAAELEKEGIQAEVVDIRTIRPLDEAAIFASVSKTHRVVVVQEGFPYAGVGAELSARIQEACFDALDAPILRVCNRDVNQPYATNLEQLVLPSVARIIEAARAVVAR